MSTQRSVPRRLRKVLLAAAVPLALSGCAYAAPAPAPAVPVAQGPALWRVADEDTTIYLFGTIHALPKSVDWYDGEIATALAASQDLVTEIPRGAVEDPEAQQMIALRAVLPPGKSMRDMLGPKDRAVYEAAMTKVGMPVDSFDRFEPWFAGMTLAVLPLIQKGYSADSGVEKVIDSRAAATVRRDALETFDAQIAMFDTMPEKSQVAFLMATAKNIDTLVPNMDAMVGEWLEGDADALARLMNVGLDDRTVADTLLYARNKRWADWIAQRLAQPGTVFLAVGAGHLAGSKSVQDVLARKGIAVTRVQ